MTEFDFWFVMILMVRAFVCVMLCGVLESLPHSVVRASGGAVRRAVMRGCDSVVRFEKKVAPLQGLPTVYCPMAGMPLARWQRRCDGGKREALKICR